MPASEKHIAVVIEATAPDRIAEALRAAVGLGLRGDRVTALLAPDAWQMAAIAGGGEPDRADRGADGDGDPRVVPSRAAATAADNIARAVATLRLLGQRVARLDAGALCALRDADAVEVWT